MANELIHADVGSQLDESEYDGILAHILNNQAQGDLVKSNTAVTGLDRLAKGADGTILVAGASDIAYETVPPRNAMVPAAAMESPGTNGAADGFVDGTNISYATKDYDQTTEEHADFSIELPPEYTGGNLLWQAIWTAAAGAGGVAWEINTRNSHDGDVIDAALTDMGSMVDTLLALGDRHLSPTLTQSASLPSAGATVVARVSRDVADAGDTLTGDARLIAILLQIPVRGS